MDFLPSPGWGLPSFLDWAWSPTRAGRRSPSGAAIGFTLVWQSARTVAFPQGAFVMPRDFFDLIGTTLCEPFLPVVNLGLMASPLLLESPKNRAVFETHIAARSRWPDPSGKNFVPE